MKKIILITICLLAGFSQAAFASYVGDDISLNGKYGSSWDGSSKELWKVLSDAGYMSLSNDVYLDITGGTPSSSYHVYNNPFWQFQYGYTSSMVSEVAGYAPRNRFGWYENGYSQDVGDSSKSTWAQLFSGPDSAGATAIFSDTNQIGFWLNPNGQNGRYYFSDTALNNGALQAITFYLGDYGYSNEYLVCFEDLRYGAGNDNDFQDMIVKVRASTPEPATMSLLGLGLAGLLRFRRKKSAKL